MQRLVVALTVTLASCAKATPPRAAVDVAQADRTVADAVVAHPGFAPLSKVPPVVIGKAEDAPEVGSGSAHLPPCVADLTLGMPMVDAEARHTMSAPDTLLDFRLQREETFASGPVSEVTYYFDGDLPGHPLYELIVEWRSPVERDAWVQASLGAANAGDQWSVPGMPWPVRAWVFDNRYVVAAAMPGTEWAE